MSVRTSAATVGLALTLGGVGSGVLAATNATMTSSPLEAQSVAVPDPVASTGAVQVVAADELPPADAAPPASAVVVDPLLATLEAGAGVGGPIVCATIGSLAGTATSSLPPDLAQPITDLSVQFSAACNQAATAGAVALGDARDQAASLAALNDVLRPAMLQFSDAVRAFGLENQESFAPLGPLVITLADNIAFFAGPG